MKLKAACFPLSLACSECARSRTKWTQREGRKGHEGHKRQSPPGCVVEIVYVALVLWFARCLRRLLPDVG